VKDALKNKGGIRMQLVDLLSGTARDEYARGMRMSPEDIKLNGLVDFLVTIASYLMTEEVSKASGHGTFAVYEDNRLKVVLDTYVPNLKVFVNTGLKREKWACVLAREYTGLTHVYRPGLWEQYVQNWLFPKAQVAEERASRERREKKQEQKKINFSPVADEELFVDVDVCH
jgi:hypothetical protein